MSDAESNRPAANAAKKQKYARKADNASCSAQTAAGAHGVARVDGTGISPVDASRPAAIPSKDDFEVHEPDYDAFTNVYIDRVHPLDRSADATANLRGSTHADADGRPPGKMMPMKTESYDEDDDVDASADLRAAPGAPHGNCTPASATRDGNQHTVRPTLVLHNGPRHLTWAIGPPASPPADAAASSAQSTPPPLPHFLK
ncbi:hypothetical protein M885DRAFT_627024 [Pelagophyceae sp. CCMP2097]|nr:hypothetical protein M885DRAFT_627024 [Pelagophyceae sp. CCMP2097]